MDVLDLGSPSYPNQAHTTLVALYKRPLGCDDPAGDDITSAQPAEEVPTVFDRSDIGPTMRPPRRVLVSPRRLSVHASSPNDQGIAACDL